MGKKKKNPHLFQHFTSVTQIHRSTLTAPQSPHGSPISPSRHYLARNITPHQPPTLRSPNAGNPILPPLARGYPRPTPQRPPNPRPPLGGARRWAGVDSGGLGRGPPLPDFPIPPAATRGGGGPEASPTAPPLPGGALPCPSQGREEEAGYEKAKKPRPATGGKL